MRCKWFVLSLYSACFKFIRLIIFQIHLDCLVYKFPRTDALDVCPEIPVNIKLHPLQDEQELSVEGAKVKIIHTPGHTTDHVILTMEDGILFSGDCILGLGLYSQACQILHFVLF